MFEVQAEAASLYKFYSFNARNLEALSEPYVWFSKLDSFNDPFEGVVREVEIKGEQMLLPMMKKYLKYKHKMPAIEAEKALLQHLLRAPEEAAAEYQQIAEDITNATRADIEKLSFFCLFRENPERSPHEKLLMWSHYSDGLRGMRLEFDTGALLDSLEVPSGAVIAHPVKYVSEPPTVSVMDYLSLLSDKISFKDCAEIVFNRVAFKNTAWEYEQEYRIISHQAGMARYSPDAIKEVVFGEKMPDRQKRIAYKLLRAHGSNTKFKVAKISRWNYEIVFEEYVN
ncbi:DUF2971 domain-containing protein [Pseudomonas sp. PDM13]|uniref:DUF2971 domain-containing protein n=1 Tax=Pseudomonas sp. PDM13 TaxID=2769255 RepID=UPI0021E01355|nr:DUF2971 domain-containing protein [Pseudomonas sp. PDM13]MCU9947481.1 DUF2971 domain-containing protein [Pseudomonas sp. PDM13]